MDRNTFFSGQTVIEPELNGLEDNIEKADAHAANALAFGAFPAKGLTPTTTGSDLVVSVAAGNGYATDADGDLRLVRLLAPDTIDLATHVPNADKRYVLVGLRFVRVNTNPRTDDESVTVFYDNAEGSELVAVDGAVAASPTKPAVPDDVVPIADFLLVAGQTVLDTKDIDQSRARPSWVRQGVTGGVQSVVQDIAAKTSANCHVRSSEPGDMKVHVKAGRINVAWKSVNVSAQATADLVAPSAGNKYIALIWLDDSGSVQVSYGDEVALAGSAVAPSHVGRFPLAHVTLLDSTAAVTPDLIEDVRPFLKTPMEVPQHDVQTAGVGQTVFDLPFTYLPGTNTLEVFVGGGKQVVTASYTETDGDTVTFLAPMVGGEVVEFLAPQTGEANPVLAHAPNHDADGSDPIDYAAIGGTVVPGLEIYGSGNDIFVKPFAAVVDGKLRVSNGTLNQSGLAGTMDVSSWYYLYAKWTGAVMALEYSHTGPDATRRTMSGDATRTYLCAFRSTSTSVVRSFIRRNRKTTYLISYAAVAGGGAQDGLIASHTGDTSLTSLALDAALPPHCREAELDVTIIGGGGEYTTIRPSGTGLPENTGSKRINSTGATAGQNPTRVWMAVGTDQKVKVQNDANGTQVDVFPLSYED